MSFKYYKLICLVLFHLFVIGNCQYYPYCQNNPNCPPNLINIGNGYDPITNQVQPEIVVENNNAPLINVTHPVLGVISYPSDLFYMQLSDSSEVINSYNSRYDLSSSLGVQAGLSGVQLSVNAIYTSSLTSTIFSDYVYQHYFSIGINTANLSVGANLTNYYVKTIIYGVSRMEYMESSTCMSSSSISTTINTIMNSGSLKLGMNNTMSFKTDKTIINGGLPTCGNTIPFCTWNYQLSSITLQTVAIVGYIYGYTYDIASSNAISSYNKNNLVQYPNEINGCNSGCFDTNMRIKSSDLMNKYCHLTPLSGLNTSDGNNWIWFTYHHVVILQDCVTEIESIYLKIGDVLCGGFIIKTLKHKIEHKQPCNYNTLSMKIKIGDVTISTKHHKGVGLMSQLKELFYYLIDGYKEYTVK